MADVPAGIAAVIANGWKWDYFEFCKQTGLDLKSEKTKEFWFKFQESADRLRAIPPELLAVIGTPSG